MKITIIDIGLLVIAMYIIIEGIISYKWEWNDKNWMSQTARVVRTFSGVAIVCLTLLGSIY